MKLNDEMLRQVEEASQLIFELTDSSDDGFDKLLNIHSALEEAVENETISMVEVGNALSQAKSGNTSLAMEISDKIEDRVNEIEKELDEDYDME